MSKFINELNVRLSSDKRRYVIPPEFELLKVTEELSNDNYARKYSVGVSFKADIVVADGVLDLKQGDVFEYMKENVKAQFKEAVYGDLRTILLNLERAVLNCDFPSALNLIKSIKEEVY
jgi:hypothetical protein